MKARAGIFNERADAGWAPRNLAALGIPQDQLTVLAPGGVSEAAAPPTEEVSFPASGPRSAAWWEQPPAPPVASPYRQGFETALSPAVWRKPDDAAVDQFARRHRDGYRDAAFRRGYERGRRYDDTQRQRVPGGTR